MHGVRTYWNHLLGPGGYVLIWAPFSWFSFVFNGKRGVRTYWNLLSSGWGCDTYLATAHPKGPVHLFGGVYLGKKAQNFSIANRNLFPICSKCYFNENNVHTTFEAIHCSPFFSSIAMPHHCNQRFLRLLLLLLLPLPPPVHFPLCYDVLGELRGGLLGDHMAHRRAGA